MTQAVIFPYIYFADPDRGRPLFGAKVYLGEVDQDPQINPIQAYQLQEDGTQVPVSQPLVTGAGGIVTISGSPVTITVDENAYSMRVCDAQDNEVYYLQDVTGAGAIDPNEFVERAGDTMTGGLDWLDGQGDLRCQTITDEGFNGFRVFDLDGENALIRLFTDGTDSRLLVNSSGNIGFIDAAQTTGNYRFIIQSDDGTTRHAVLGTPWPPTVGTQGYDHLQLYFYRLTETPTPFIVCETDDFTQFWVGPDGGLVCSGAAEVRNFEDDGSGGWGIYSTDGGALDTILVITPGVNILEGGAGNEVYYSGKVFIDTNATSDSSGTVNRFEFTEDGNLKIPGLADPGGGTRALQVEADGTLVVA